MERGKLVRITSERDFLPSWREAGDRSSAGPGLPEAESPSLVDLMRMTRAEWDAWTRGSAIRRAGYAGFKQDVAVALGNWLTSVAEASEVAVLRDVSEDDEPLVREHAAWALEQLRT